MILAWDRVQWIPIIPVPLAGVPCLQVRPPGPAEVVLPPPPPYLVSSVGFVAST